MKKLGNFCMGFVPLIAALALSEGVSVFLMGMSAIVLNWSFITGAAPGSSSYSWNDLVSYWTSYGFSALIMVAYSITCMIIFGWWYRAVYSKDVRKTISIKLNAVMIIGLILMVPAVQMLTTYIVSIVASLFPSALDAYYELEDSVGLTDQLSVGLLLYTCILAPISEEVIFRGITLKQFNKCLPFCLANIMQALCFGIFHHNLIQGSYAFFLALLLGYVCKKSNNLCCSILLHMLYNFYGSVIEKYIYIYPDTVASVIVFFVISCAVMVMGIAVYNKGIERELITEIPPDNYQGMQ